MGRPIEPDIGIELLNHIVDYALEHGLANLSFRSLAQELGVSTYKFVYHFGSKDKLIAAIVAEIERRERQEIKSWLNADTWTLASLMRCYWQWSIQPKSQLLIRLFFEVRSLAMREPHQFGKVVAESLSEGLTFAEEVCTLAGVEPEQIKPIATMMTDIIRGLQLDLLTTGDVERTTTALNKFADLIDGYIDKRQYIN